MATFFDAAVGCIFSWGFLMLFRDGCTFCCLTLPNVQGIVLRSLQSQECFDESTFWTGTSKEASRIREPMVPDGLLVTGAV
mmetsp:Transcript_102578/g.142978  ORF Transcript_102578/g.142978 Transcript_102578/m.142978 type:complete len:81 (+) Transcript_102578:1231-1473(+)